MRRFTYFLMFLFVMLLFSCPDSNTNSVTFQVFDGDNWYTYYSEPVQKGDSVDVPDYLSFNKKTSIKNTNRDTLYKWKGTWGLSKDLDGNTEAVDINDEIDGNMTYYAQYSNKPLEKFQVEYYAFDGSGWKLLSDKLNYEGDVIEYGDIDEKDVSATDNSGSNQFEWTGEWTEDDNIYNANREIFDSQEPVTSNKKLYAVYDIKGVKWKFLYLKVYNGSDWETAKVIQFKDKKISQPPVSVNNIQLDNNRLLKWDGNWCAAPSLTGQAPVFSFEDSEVTDGMYLYARYIETKIPKIVVNTYDGDKWNQVKVVSCPSLTIEEFEADVPDFYVNDDSGDKITRTTYTFAGNWSYESKYVTNNRVDFSSALDSGAIVNVYAVYTVLKTENYPLLRFHSFDGEKWKLMSTKYSSSCKLESTPRNVSSFNLNGERPVMYSFLNLWSKSSSLDTNFTSAIDENYEFPMNSYVDLYAVYKAISSNYPVVNFNVYNGKEWEIIESVVCKDYNLVSTPDHPSESFTYRDSQNIAHYEPLGYWTLDSSLDYNMVNKLTLPMTLSQNTVLNVYASYKYESMETPIVNYYKNNGTGWVLVKSVPYPDEVVESFDYVPSFEYKINKNRVAIYTSKNAWSTSDNLSTSAQNAVSAPYKVLPNTVTNLYAVYDRVEKSVYTVRFMRPKNKTVQNGSSISSYTEFRSYVVKEDEKFVNPTKNMSTSTLINNFRITTMIGSKVYQIRHFDGINWSLTRDENGNNAPYNLSNEQYITSDLTLYPIYPKYKTYNYSSLSTTNWMSFIPNYTSTYAITIPGTHDSVCTEKKLTFSRTQNNDVGSQLKMGVRAFDFRVKNDNVTGGSYGLALYHSKIPQFKTLETKINDCINFLRDNPSEVIFAFIKPEECDSDDIEDRLERLLNDKSSWIFRNDDEFPSVIGEARGKIVIITRGFGVKNSIWIGGWEDNCTFEGCLVDNTIGDSNRYWCQDCYDCNFNTAAKKGTDSKNRTEKARIVTDFMVRCASSNNRNLFINFASGWYYKRRNYGLFHAKDLTPTMTEIADVVNPACLMKFGNNLQKDRKFEDGRCYGIMKFDFIDKQLAVGCFLQNREVAAKYLQTYSSPNRLFPSFYL